MDQLFTLIDAQVTTSGLWTLSVRNNGPKVFLFDVTLFKTYLLSCIYILKLTFGDLYFGDLRPPNVYI